MLAFVDESGDTGRKLEQGSSSHFVVAMVTFEDHDDALACDDRITALRSELKLSQRQEFHFAVNSNRLRKAFLEAVTPFPFSYHVFALNKDPRKLYGPGFAYKDSLYKYASRLTFENAKPYLNSAIVVMDECGNRKFRIELAKYLRARIKGEGGNQLIKKVKLQRSSGNNLLQLADYVACVATRVINGAADGLELRRKYLAAHELSFEVWPK